MFALAKPGKLQLKLLDYNVLLVELCPPSQGLLRPSSSPSPPIAKHLYWNYIAFLLPTRTKISLGFAASFFLCCLCQNSCGARNVLKNNFCQIQFLVYYRRNVCKLTQQKKDEVGERKRDGMFRVGRAAYTDADTNAHTLQLAAGAANTQSCKQTPMHTLIHTNTHRHTYTQT